MQRTTTLEVAHARRPVTALNRCIEICTDCAHGFSTASAAAQSKTLRVVLGLYELQHGDLARALEAERDQLGYEQDSERGGRDGARLHLLGRNDDAVVAECARTERAALHVYDGLLHHSDMFRARTRVLIAHQRNVIADAVCELQHRLSFQRQTAQGRR